jgi:hypothetical protein
MNRSQKADWFYKDGPVGLAADLKGQKPMLASLLVAAQVAEFHVQPLGATVLSLGQVNENQGRESLDKMAEALAYASRVAAFPTNKPIAKRVIHAQVLNNLAEAQVEAFGLIDRLLDSPSSEIVLATGLTHESLLSLGHHRPAVFLSDVLSTPITTIHYRVDLARRRGMGQEK